jgi:hypothetical protein
MKVYSIKTLLLHLTIAFAYVSTTSYFFVIANQPNPVGTGLQQWLCIFLHLTVTLFMMLSFVGKATDKRDAKIKFCLHLASIVLIISTLLLFSNPLWEWLWLQR